MAYKTKLYRNTYPQQVYIKGIGCMNTLQASSSAAKTKNERTSQTEIKDGRHQRERRVLPAATSAAPRCPPTCHGPVWNNQPS